jgi:hypothetical protein
MASDLTADEQEAVRAAMRFLRIRFGKNALLAEAVRIKEGSLRSSMNGHKSVSAAVAFRVARLAAVGVDDFLAGRYPVKGMCPHCGRGP